MTTVLLYIICVLLIGDLYFLFRIYKKGIKGNETLSDEKYFELKYNINLLKAISAILIFGIGFLGYSNYMDFKKEMKKDLTDNLTNQNIEIGEIKTRLNKYNETLDSLDVLKNKLLEITKENEKEMKAINRKVLGIKETLKFNPKIYVVTDLKYPYTNIKSYDTVQLNFSSMKTIFGESLPEFNNIPFVNIQSHRADIDIMEVTKTSIKFLCNSYYGDGHENYPDYYYFDLWIASF